MRTTTNICNDPISARCVDDSLELNSGSELTTCYNQHEINQDVQNQFETTSQLADSERVLLLERISLLEQRVLETESTLENLFNLDISNWQIQNNCLIDSCNSPVLTLGQLIQALVNKACETLE